MPQAPGLATSLILRLSHPGAASWTAYSIHQQLQLAIEADGQDTKTWTLQEPCRQLPTVAGGEQQTFQWIPAVLICSCAYS
jgi:hypothetical protein